MIKVREEAPGVLTVPEMLFESQRTLLQSESLLCFVNPNSHILGVPSPLLMTFSGRQKERALFLPERISTTLFSYLVIFGCVVWHAGS